MESAILTLIKLRWNIDSLVFLAEYNSYYWLTAHYDDKGIRNGITSCCEFDYECEHHKKLRKLTENQNINQN